MGEALMMWKLDPDTQGHCNTRRRRGQKLQVLKGRQGFFDPLLVLDVTELSRASAESVLQHFLLGQTVRYLLAVRCCMALWG